MVAVATFVVDQIVTIVVAVATIVVAAATIVIGVATELDWLEAYQRVDPPRLYEVVSGSGWIQKWSHFQLDSLFSPHPCAKAMGGKASRQSPMLIGLNGFTPLFKTSSMHNRASPAFFVSFCDSVHCLPLNAMKLHDIAEANILSVAKYYDKWIHHTLSLREKLNDFLSIILQANRSLLSLLMASFTRPQAPLKKSNMASQGQVTALKHNFTMASTATNAYVGSSALLCKV